MKIIFQLRGTDEEKADLKKQSLEAGFKRVGTYVRKITKLGTTKQDRRIWHEIKKMTDKNKGENLIS